jgi:type I restriction enzyme S subunit
MAEDLYELPKGWVWAFLSELGELNRGKSKHRPRDDARLYGGKYPFIQTGDVRNSNSVIKTYTQTYNEFGLAQSKLWDKDTLCITIAANIAETALLGIPACFPDSIVGFISDNRVCSVHYIHYFIKSIKTKLDSYAPATAQKNINLNILRIVSVPLPPLAEQHRIVAKIEELFTQLDAGVELLKKVKAKLKRYRQAVLKAAVEGNLTKEWREANQGELEPASVLLERILKQRREKWEAEQLAKMKAQGKTPKDDSWKLKYKEPVSPDTSDLPDLPDGWCWISAEQCTSLITDGEHITPERSESGVLLLSARNVKNGWLSLEEVDYVPEHIYKILAKRLVVQPGDVLLSCSGTVGRSCVAPEKLKFALVRSVAVLKPFFLMGRFLSYSIRSPLLQSQINEKKTQTAQANIFQGKIKKLVFALPNLLEQEKIVKEIEYCFSVIDQLEKTVDTNIKRAEKLRQTILKQAFEGKLVAQDPNDEPAEKLLERIKAEKAKREADKKPKGQSTIKPKQPRKSKTTATQLELKLDD